MLKRTREREIVKNIKYIRFADYDKYFTPSTMYHPSFDFSEIDYDIDMIHDINVGLGTTIGPVLLFILWRV